VFALLFVSNLIAITYAGNRDFCCGQVNPGKRVATSLAIWPPIAQVDIAGGADIYWVSSATSQDVRAFPSGLFPNPPVDPTGLQTLYNTRQVSAAAATLGMSSNDIVFSHGICIGSSACNASLARYKTYVANLNPKPAISFVISISASNELIIGYNSAFDAVLYNRSTTDSDSGCGVEFIALSSPSVAWPASSFSSVAILSGRFIHTSLMTSPTINTGVTAQTTKILTDMESLIKEAHSNGNRNDFIKIYASLVNIADKPLMDIAFQNFFSGYNKPVRVVSGGLESTLPHQAGAKVALRLVARTPVRRNGCNSETPALKYYTEPTLFRENYNVASQQISFGNLVFTGEVLGDKPDQPLSAISSDEMQQYTDALTNMEVLGFTAGVDRGDLIWLESTQTNVLVSYVPSTNAITNFFNGSDYTPPAVTFDSLTNFNNVSTVLSGVFYNDNTNYKVFPTWFEWSRQGLLYDQIFGAPIGTFANNTDCEYTTLPTCPKPSYYYTSFPANVNSNLGTQDSSFSSRETNEVRVSSSETRSPESIKYENEVGTEVFNLMKDHVHRHIEKYRSQSNGPVPSPFSLHN